METGSQALAGWREGNGVSQGRVASSLGVTQATVAGWEAGHRRPELHTALALEDLTEGDVPVESWGYSGGLMDAARRVLARRDLDPNAIAPDVPEALEPVDPTGPVPCPPVDDLEARPSRTGTEG